MTAWPCASAIYFSGLCHSRVLWPCWQPEYLLKTTNECLKERLLGNRVLLCNLSERGGRVAPNRSGCGRFQVVSWSVVCCASRDLRMPDPPAILGVSLWAQPLEALTAGDSVTQWIWIPGFPPQVGFVCVMYPLFKYLLQKMNFK